MQETGFPLLTLYTFAPVLGMVAVLLIPSKRADIIKTVAAAAAAVPMLLGFYILFTFQDSGHLQYRESLLWVKGLNIHYALGIDGLSAPMIVLSGLVGFVAVVASWGIEKQIKGYFALILLLLSGMNGVFCALDFFLFYVFWELMLLPMYFLIGIWGGPNRVYAAIKFFLYTMAGSVLMLVVLLACWYWSDGSYAVDEVTRQAVMDLKENEVRNQANAWRDLEESAQRGALNLSQKRMILAQREVQWVEEPEKALAQSRFIDDQLRNLPPAIGGRAAATQARRESLLSRVDLGRTFDLLELKDRYRLFLGGFQLFGFLPAVSFAGLMFLFLYVAFAIKVPVFPFHTWLPWAHVEAPTAISVILAGILLKMGVYGFLRISFALFPTQAIYFAVPIAALGVFNILYGACCAMAQDDMKKLVAYSSVSHMGFCMLGLGALTRWGMTGSVLQMFNHGTSTSMMFLLVGVIYDRAHHRDINKFGGLAKPLPIYAGFMTLALFASMGLPGLSGFIGEIAVFLGSFQSNLAAYSPPHYLFQSMTVLAALGVILTAGYLLWMMQRVFFGPLNEKYKDYLDLSPREAFTLAPLAILVVVFGVWPQPLIDLTSKSVAELQSFVIKSRPEGPIEAEVPAAFELARSGHPAQAVAQEEAQAAIPALPKKEGAGKSAAVPAPSLTDPKPSVAGKAGG